MDTENLKSVDPDTVDPLVTPELESDTAADFVSLTEERDRLAAEKADLQDQLLRRAAEFENFRRRTERDKLELSEYASMEAVKALLPILDDFERAINVESSDKEYAKGTELIHQRFFGVLQKLGLEPIEAVGQTFDPNLHHAIERQETTEAEDQQILSEFQRGYNFRGRLLRPSLVKVAVNS